MVTVSWFFWTFSEEPKLKAAFVPSLAVGAPAPRGWSRVEVAGLVEVLVGLSRYTWKRRLCRRTTGKNRFFLEGLLAWFVWSVGLLGGHFLQDRFGTHSEPHLSQDPFGVFLRCQLQWKSSTRQESTDWSTLNPWAYAIPPPLYRLCDSFA